MRLFISLLIGLLATLHANSQTYYFEKFSVKEGLAHSKVYFIYQDSTGYVWLGTPSGVSRYDGTSFKNFSSADGLASGGVQYIAVDNKNTMWLGHLNGGISTYKDGVFKQINLPNIDLKGGDISAILPEQNGDIWIATSSSGAIRISSVLGNNKKIQQYKGKEGLSDQIFGITQGNDGTIYINIIGGIKVYRPDTDDFEFLHIKDLPSFYQYTSFFEDKEGNFWIGTQNDGVYRYNIKSQTFSFFDIKDGLADNWITCFTQDHLNNVWVGTFRGGLTRFNKDSLTVYNSHNGLSENKIRSLTVDREGNLLVGSFNNGFSIFKGEQFITYDDNFGLPSPQVNAILHDSKNNVWFGTVKGILCYNKSTHSKITYIIRDEQLDQKLTDNKGINSSNNEIISIKEDKNGKIWIACKNKGVYQLNDETNEFLYIPRVNPSHYSIYVTSMDIDQSNNLWIGTAEGLVYYNINTDTRQILSQRSGLASSKITSVFADSTNKVWIGSQETGVTLISGEETTIIPTDSTLNLGIGITPVCYCSGANNSLWIGTEDDGLLYYDGKNISKQYTIKNGLTSNYVTAIIIDKHNKVWIGNGRGVNQLDPQTDQINYYNEKTGFTGIEVRPNAIYRDSLDNLWFGTAKGVNVFNANKELHSKLEPLTRISRLRINLKDRTFTEGQKIELTYKEHAVHIDYSSVWLTNPNGVSYKIMLVGLDNAWQMETRQTDVNYSYLKPGEYTFKVKAKNHEGIWNTEPAELKFTINPPFWLTWWFNLGVATVVFAIIYVFIQWRERNLILEKEKLEAIVTKRTAELGQKNTELEARNKDITDSIRYAKRIQKAVLPTKEALQSVLPEHFIFFKPRDIVSGDYYWMSQQGNKTIITAVDCTGHGVPGAFLSMLGVSFLNEIVSKSQLNTAADILEELRKYVISSLKQTGKSGDSQDGMDMALCIIDPDKQELQYAGANNPLLFIHNNETSIIKADKMPIGIYQKQDKKFKNNVIQYSTGDSFYIFSDGYPDQFGGERNRKFMRKRFQELIQSIQEYDMDRQRNILESEFDKWKGNLHQIDDVIVIGVRLTKNQ